MAIVLSNISKRFGEQLVVNQVSLEVEDGELFVLLGSSGSGKSTVLRIIAGLIAPESGRVKLQGKDVTDLPPQLRGIGFVFQNYAIFRHMTVAENVEFGLKIRKVSRAERRRRREFLLELVGLGGLGGRMPNQLSGGQRQRVALARALAYEPAVLLLDEPFGALDLKIRCQLRRSLKEIQRQIGVTTILVTHDQEEAFELGDRVAVLERGRLLESGSPQELYYKPHTEFVAAFLGGGNVMVGRSDKGRIRLGAAVLPFPPGAPVHEEGAPVRILFRPETVKHQPEPFAASTDVVTIGQGRVTLKTFTGPVEKLRFELETLQGVRPAAPALAYGQRFANIEATQESRSNGGSNDAALGDLRWIGLSNFHVLDPSALKFLAVFDRAQPGLSAVQMAKLLGLASHGTTTLLKSLAPDDAVEAVQQELQLLLQNITPHGEPRFETRLRPAQGGREITREVQEGYYDLVIIGRPPQSDQEGVRRVTQLTRRLLIQSGVPVLLASSASSSIRRMLICTAAGEPGKTDVRFGARLARHIHAFTTIFHAAHSKASEEEVKRARHHLEQAREMLSAYDVPNEIKIGQEPVMPSILNEIETGKHDLVILGASGSSSVRSADDLVSRIVTLTDCSVLIVPMVPDVD
ncbi:MAG: ATP-binding cassette domain-containing protein [Deltaproteobacteria bacterium]|nr:ATP-binding cassette domain-containing protein [Deltaproteobacteria bacterium]